MTKELNFNGKIQTPDVRMLHDMNDVMYDSKWSSSAENKELYYMYRDLYKNEKDHEKIESKQLRYDITIIPPQTLGEEYVKTAGHYHPNVPEHHISYAEVYQVLEGEAVYLLQKASEDAIEDVIVVEAKAKDIVVIPPDYGHITINKSDKELMMANWVSREFSSMYTTIKEHAGGTYFLLKDGYKQNPKYTNLPAIRYMKPTDPKMMGLKQNEDMYELINNIEKLDFLNNPQNYVDFFKNVLQYE